MVEPILRLARASEPHHHRKVMEAWQRFVTDGVLPPRSIRTLVEESWSRCAGQGVDPTRRAAPVQTTEDALSRLCERNRDFIVAARQVCAQAREFLAESGTIMVVTDAEGVILHVEGDPSTVDAAQEIQLAPGGNWDEGVAGTNAIGTALAACQPVQIHAAEHFCEGIKRWTCSATVIEDPFDRGVLGAIDISGLRSTYDPHCLALAVTTASRIAERLMRLALERRAKLLDATLLRFVGGTRDGLIVFDDRGRLVKVNEYAGPALLARGVQAEGPEGPIIASLRDNRLVDAAGRPLDTVRPEWTETVLDGREALGTLVIIPQPGPPRRTTTSPPAQTPRHPGFEAILAASPAMAEQVERARRLAGLPVPVLLLGETGTGKEVFARAIHAASAFRDGPFIALNCGGLPRELLASELFGYAEGAFTGARRGGLSGKIEAADGGTLFLDEIGEMPADLQPHFLRVLQEGEFYRLGETTSRKVRFRLLAATHRDLRREVAEERFRMDLFYRLSVMTLTLPALRERRADIVPLARHFMQQAAITYGIAPKPLAAELCTALVDHDWPGNARELRNAVEAMLLMSSGPALTLADLPVEYYSHPTLPAVGHDAVPAPGNDAVRLEDTERQAIVAAIERAGGNLTQVARMLGIAKSTLYVKLKKFDIGR